MKTLLRPVLATLFLIGMLTITGSAQTSAQEIADNLRLQLNEVEVRQAELQARKEQLEDDLNPENIQRSLAGVGSTRPEDLREQRRRQLELAKARIVVELDQLDRTHARLEAAIVQADAEAYWESADVVVQKGPDN